MGGTDFDRKLESNVKGLQLNVEGLLSLLGGDKEDRQRFFEILRGITTPAEFQLAQHALDSVTSGIDLARASLQQLEVAARAVKR